MGGPERKIPSNFPSVNSKPAKETREINKAFTPLLLFPSSSPQTNYILIEGPR